MYLRQSRSFRVSAQQGQGEGKRITQNEFTDKAWQSIIAAPDIAKQVCQSFPCQVLNLVIAFLLVKVCQTYVSDGSDSIGRGLIRSFGTCRRRTRLLRQSTCLRPCWSSQTAWPGASCPRLAPMPQTCWTRRTPTSAASPASVATQRRCVMWFSNAHARHCKLAGVSAVRSQCNESGRLRVSSWSLCDDPQL